MTKYNNQRWDGWMRAALKGDQKAYRLLLTSLRLWLAAYFTKRVHYNAVEDLVQDTLLTLHAKRQTFDPHYSFGPWIAAVARHRWIDHLRATLKYVETKLDDNFLYQETERDACAKHDVKALLKLIPPPQAKVIELVKLRELSIEEVSKQTGHSPSSVKVMVHRGMKKMMAAVEEVQDDL
jgi:RNA polymerase sigma-70 factor (ECF subfamily)